MCVYVHACVFIEGGEGLLCVYVFVLVKNEPKMSSSIHPDIRMILPKHILLRALSTLLVEPMCPDKTVS